MAATINAGRVRFVSRGTYNNSTQYYLFDLVDYNGSSYIAKENTLGNLPTNTQYWQLIAEKGNTGNTGQTGPVGATGNGIASIRKTSTSGLVDTYTITYTNGNTTTFTVTNGEDGEVTQTQFDDLQQRVEDAEKNQLTNTPTPATSHYLQDSADSRFRKFIPIGRTTQESTTGKQLFNINGNYAIINNGIPSVNGEELTVSGTNTSLGMVGVSSEAISINQNTDYIINGKIKSGLSSARIAAQFKENESDNWGGYTAIFTGIGTINKTINSGNYKFIRILFYCWTSTPSTVTPAVFDEIMLSTNGGDYEPYTGGEPAPNPKYPFPIKNTGDNGSVNEKVQNKNLWNGDNIYLNQTYTQNSSIKLGYFEGKAGTYTISLTEQLSNGCYVYVGANGSIIPTMNKKATFTLAKSGRHVVWIVIRAGTYTNFVSKIQIEPGSTPTSYVPHSEQNISFPLAEGQKFYEGSHPDDDEKVHHQMREIVLDGVTDGLKFTTAEPNRNNRFILNLSDIKRRTYTENSYMKSSHFSYNTTVYFDSQDQDGFCANNLGLFVRFGSNSEINTLTKANNWLAEHLPKFQYELAEEVTEDFTEEQKTAWEEIKALRTYKNVTHISSEDETPANVDIEYVQDTKTYIDNKVTALTNAITSLGGNV